MLDNPLIISCLTKIKASESLFESVETSNLDVNPVERSPKFIQKLLNEDEKIVDIHTDKKERENG